MTWIDALTGALVVAAFALVALLTVKPAWAVKLTVWLTFALGGVLVAIGYLLGIPRAPRPDDPGTIKPTADRHDPIGPQLTDEVAEDDVGIDGERDALDPDNFPRDHPNDLAVLDAWGADHDSDAWDD